jgi:hypothetical protein
MSEAPSNEKQKYLHETWLTFLEVRGDNEECLHELEKKVIDLEKHLYPDHDAIAIVREKILKCEQRMHVINAGIDAVNDLLHKLPKTFENLLDLQHFLESQPCEMLAIDTLQKAIDSSAYRWLFRSCAKVPDNENDAKKLLRQMIEKVDEEILQVMSLITRAENDIDEGLNMRIFV